jgi:transcriptional regulator with XRE-family HTH domain
MARKKVGLSAHDVKRKTGISAGNISGLETGRYLPSTKALISLSKLYGVSTDWILKGEEEEKAEQIDPVLIEMIDSLKTVWNGGDEKIKIWLEVQFQILKALKDRQKTK